MPFSILKSFKDLQTNLVTQTVSLQLLVCWRKISKGYVLGCCYIFFALFFLILFKVFLVVKSLAVYVVSANNRAVFVYDVIVEVAAEFSFR